MKASRNPFALVIDEYGGFTGIITRYDLLGAIVGDIDEGTDGSALIEKTAVAGEWRIDGSAPLDKVAAVLDVKLPTDEYETFAGFVLGILDKLPEDGEHTEIESAGLAIKLLEVKDHRLKSALVRLTSPPSPPV
jgi:putative hemolysin